MTKQEFKHQIKIKENKKYPEYKYFINGIYYKSYKDALLMQRINN